MTAHPFLIMISKRSAPCSGRSVGIGDFSILPFYRRRCVAGGLDNDGTIHLYGVFVESIEGDRLCGRKRNAVFETDNVKISIGYFAGAPVRGIRAGRTVAVVNGDRTGIDQAIGVTGIK